MDDLTEMALLLVELQTKYEDSDYYAFSYYVDGQGKSWVRVDCNGWDSFLIAKSSQFEDIKGAYRCWLFWRYRYRRSDELVPDYDELRWNPGEGYWRGKRIEDE